MCRIFTIKDKPLRAYKKVFVNGGPRTAVLVLEIPIGAKMRTCHHISKCRVSRAFVKGILKSEIPVFNIHKYQSMQDGNFEYQILRMAIPDHFDEDPTVTCSTGIHCFLDSRDAIRYPFREPNTIKCIGL